MNTPLSAADRSALEAVPALRGLAPEARDAVLAAVEVVEVPAGADVFVEGEVGDACYVVLGGEVEVHRVDDHGESVRLALLEPTATFGEVALLGDVPQLRSASVRATRATRCARIPQEAFRTLLLADPGAREVLSAEAEDRLQARLFRTLRALRGLESAAVEQGLARRLQAPLGRVVVREGDPADAVYLILRGSVLVTRGQGERLAELATLGPGHVFGERGVLNRAPRSATVVASTEVTLLRIEGEAFRGWCAEHPELRDHFEAFLHLHAFPDGRALSVYRHLVDGRPAVTSVYGRPDGDGLVSTRCGDSIRCRAGGAPAVEHTLCFEDAATGRRRELHLAAVERDPQGTPVAGRLVGALATGLAPDVGWLHHHVGRKAVLGRADLRRFVRTGHLGAASDGGRPPVCQCMHVDDRAVELAAQLHGPGVAEVCAATGAASLCGQCLPALRRALASAGEPPGAAPKPAPPPPTSWAGRTLDRLAHLLGA